MKAAAGLAIIVGLFTAGSALMFTATLVGDGAGLLYWHASEFLVVSVGFILLGGLLQRRATPIAPSPRPAQ